MDNIQEQQKILRDAEEAELLRLDGMKLREEYHHIIDEYMNTHDNISPELEEILKRGVYCGAGLKKGGVIFTGINPSYDEIDEADLPANLLMECCGNKHWQPYVDIAATFPEYFVGYMDLFPLRESSQSKFEKDVPNDLKVNLLRLTLKKISAAAPNLIIHTYKTSQFYWGTDEEHPWMGYKLIPIEDERLVNKGTLYRIIGRTGNPRSIHIDNIDSENLVGCYLFITSFTRPRKDTKEEFEGKRLNSDDVHYLWEGYAKANVNRYRKNEAATFELTKGKERAIINIPFVGYFPMFHYFGFEYSPITHVEQEISLIEQTDRQRYEFLKRYRQLYKEMYGSQLIDIDLPSSSVAKFFCNEIHCQMKKVDVTPIYYSDEYEDEQFTSAQEIANYLSSDDIRIVEEAKMQRITINHCKPANNTSAYYLYQTIGDDIEESHRLIETLQGYLKIIGKMDDVVRLIRNAKTPVDCKKAIQKELGLSSIQASAVVSLPLSSLTGLRENMLKMNIEEEKKLLTFFERLQN